MRLPAAACWRRTNARAIGRSSPNDQVELVTRPMAAESATTEIYTLSLHDALPISRAIMVSVVWAIWRARAFCVRFQ